MLHVNDLIPEKGNLKLGRTHAMMTGLKTTRHAFCPPALRAAPWWAGGRRQLEESVYGEPR